ncbi:HET domain containing protein, partial [Pyrenophora tritici-repentis]
MRLLQYSETGELSIRCFDDGDIPPYTIISHTWGADGDEVTFADLQTGGGKTKPGYKKIVFCGEQARRDNLQTSAKPIPDFAPLYKDDPSGPKIVNFSINLVPPYGYSLESAIHALLLHEPPQFLSINQTLNEAYKKPAVISIKTKKGFYKEEDARFKLGMW